MRKVLMTIFCGLMLAGCDMLPRGAGLQSEVLAAQDTVDAQGRPEFAVETVTRDNLAIFARWPNVNTEHLHWIERVDQPNNRIIAADDMLTVTIWSTEENGLLLSPGQRSVVLPDLRVSSSGRVFLPYIGEQRVAGMSPERARAKIEEAYLTVSSSVQVLVSVSEGRARTASIIGGVASPGAFPLTDNDVTILDLLSQAGGISPGLNNPQVRMQRNGRLFGISADRLLNSPGLNTTLQGGDRVFVESDSRTFLSLGAAGSEAVHDFPKDHVTALEALSLIGGVSDARADAQGILILRRYPARTVTQDRSGPDHPRTVFTLDLTTADGLFSANQFHIQPGDLVYASESPLLIANSIFGVLGSVLRLSN